MLWDHLVKGDGVEGHGALGVQRAAGQRQAEQAEEQRAGSGRRTGVYRKVCEVLLV